MLQDGDNTYVYGLDLISATDGGGIQTYFLYDGLGSTADLTDGSGNTVAGYGYDVFGALRSGSPGTTDWLFTGEQLDADSEMYYLRARYYDPVIGRFLGRDPLPSGNSYAYVGSNPTNRVDPTGLWWLSEVMGGGSKWDKEGGGFDLDRLCPSRDPNHIYAIVDGVCYDITPPDRCRHMNRLLCEGGESGLGFLDKAGKGIWDFFKEDDSDFLQDRQSSDCGFQFGSWCALDTSLDPLLRAAADNPQCATLVTLLAVTTAVAAFQPEVAPVPQTLLEPTITTCMTDKP